MSSGELLVEIGCEELPAEWLDDLITDFAAGVESELRQALIPAGAVHSAGTPRRLVACAEGVAASQPGRVERKLGPPVRVGRTQHGEWTRAAFGFARRLGLEGPAAEDALDVFETDRGAYVGIESNIPGRPAGELLPAIIERALRGLSFPKTMQWDATIGGASFPFGRPIRWIVALFDGAVVPFRIEVAGGQPVVGGNQSRGHRFRSGRRQLARHAGGFRDAEVGGPFPVDSFASLREGLKERCVVLDPKERKRLLLTALGKADGGTGRILVRDARPPPPSHRVAGGGARAVRRRVPSRCRRRSGDTVSHSPPEVLPVSLANAVLHRGREPAGRSPGARSAAARSGSCVARLRDARFFWDEDRKVPLAETRPRLAGVVFHQRLGSFREKAGRMEELAPGPPIRRERMPLRRRRPPAGEVRPDREPGRRVRVAPGSGGRTAAPARRASRKPSGRPSMTTTGRRGSRETCRAAPEGASVALADRADTLAGLFLAGEEPSGSGDPFALRRAALSMVRVLRDAPAAYPGHRSGWPSPRALLDRALDGYRPDGETRAGVAGKLGGLRERPAPARVRGSVDAEGSGERGARESGLVPFRRRHAPAHRRSRASRGGGERGLHDARGGVAAGPAHPHARGRGRGRAPLSIRPC